MSEAKRLKLATIHDVLPCEIFVLILKKLGYNSIKNVRLTCKKWKMITDDFNLVKAALGIDKLLTILIPIVCKKTYPIWQNCLNSKTRNHLSVHVQLLGTYLH